MTELEEFLTSNDITSLLSNEKNYPSKMTIARPKNHKIFHVGNVIDYEKCVSIVGTRSCSEFGAQFAFDLAKELVNHDYKIISGLAQGIDASAHHGCALKIMELELQ